MAKVLDFSDGFTSNTAPSELISFTIGSAENITAGGTITLGSSGMQKLKVQGSPGAVTASSTPFGATPPGDGTFIIVQGRNNTNTVTLTHNDAANGCILNGNATLGLRDELVLIYDSTDARYVEMSRNF